MRDDESDVIPPTSNQLLTLCSTYVLSCFFHSFPSANDGRALFVSAWLPRTKLRIRFHPWWQQLSVQSVKDVKVSRWFEPRRRKILNISHLIQLEPPASPGISRQPWEPLLNCGFRCGVAVPPRRRDALSDRLWPSFWHRRGTAIHRKLLPEIVRRTSQNYQNCLSIPCNTLQTHQAECMQTASRITMHHDASSKFMQISQLSD